MADFPDASLLPAETRDRFILVLFVLFFIFGAVFGHFLSVQKAVRACNDNCADQLDLCYERQQINLNITGTGLIVDDRVSPGISAPSP